MTRILIAGGTGTLGGAMAIALKAPPHQIRILGHGAAPAQADPRFEWATGDVTTGTGIDAALDGVEIIINCLGSYQNVIAVDVLGVKRLAEAAARVGVRHFYHISIVGIDRVDFEFYKHKLTGEGHVMNSGVPYSIQRVTQFHAYLHFLFSQSVQLPSEGYRLPFPGGAVFQPIDITEVAAYARSAILDRPAGRLPDAGGPEVLRVDALARTFLTARGISAPSLLNPEPGRSAFPDSALPALRQGLHTAPHNAVGRIRWAEYVQAHQDRRA